MYSPYIRLLAVVSAGLLTAGSAFASSESVIYAFNGPSTDGQWPLAGLTNVSGRLYGTTILGGSDGGGTIFSVTPSGQEKVLYSFTGTNGSQPVAGLTKLGGWLYGTAQYSGAANFGTVFRISLATHKVETVYSFQGSTDGSTPLAGLINVAGTLYGTTSVGGGSGCANALGCGTVFSVTPAGKETVLHRFKDGEDGSYPWAKLIDVNGTLYGTTVAGGARTCVNVAADSCGVVFSITPTGKETVLHHFKGGSDGANPYDDLTYANGTLYGTTHFGGIGTGCGDGCGTVFSVTTSGTEKVLYSFGSGTGGCVPYSGLVYSKRILYGMTGCGGESNYGAVYSLTLSGTETVLYSFQNSPDGAGAYLGGLIDWKGKLYGTTEMGGVDNCTNGCGVVFWVQVP